MPVRALGRGFFNIARSGRRSASRRALAAGGGALADAFLAATGMAQPAQGAGSDPFVIGMAYLEIFRKLDDHELAGLALFCGVVLFAVVTAVILARTHERLRLAKANARAAAATFEGEIDRLHSLLLSEPQVIVVWDGGTAPEIIGDPAIIAVGLTADRLLSYAVWLRPEQALVLESAVDRLLGRGESFSISVMTASGRSVSAEGRAIAGRAVLRLAEVSGLRKDLAELSHRYHRLQADAEVQRALIESLPSPVWGRDAAGRLVYANAAYARAVAAVDAPGAVAAGQELLDHATRDAIKRSWTMNAVFSGLVPVTVAGATRVFEVFDVPSPRGSAGIAREANEVEALRAELARVVEAHRRILDQLATAVAIFGPDHNLAFYNSAYRELWDLDAAFLDRHPADSAVLDRLRAARRLPEQKDFRAWKAELHEAYRASAPASFEWHLPDQRTLRVVAAPGLDGGITYLFDDVTERLELERRFDALIRVQGETLDNLTEAVALFGSDGRVRLFNPVFAKMWRLQPAMLAERPHIEAVITQCHAFDRDDEMTASVWRALRAAVTALDGRDPIFRRIERSDGSVVECRTVPLPDGATLVTFQDITDSVNVERALTERNEALVEADRIKIDFVHQVSYELRSPLTNIIGFAHILGDAAAAPLTAKQAEYLGYITASSNALLAIIDNILDLASITAGAVTLDRAEVDIRATMEAATEGVQDRLVKDNIALELTAPPDIGTFMADGQRIRQILFNLLSNAVGFSPPGATVTLAADRSPQAVTFAVTDRGPGISDEMLDKVFALFETHSRGTRHRGVGLGLSIVRSFVELHGGTVRIDSVPGQGTTVICTFPLATETAQNAA
jgi:signal transduction histidine kinase